MSPERVESEAGPESRQPIEHLSTREGYDRWAMIYDDEDNPLIMLEERHLPGLLGDVHGLDVVDLGCGTGRHSIRLVGAGARGTAVGLSDGVVAQARRKPGWEQVEVILPDLNPGVAVPDLSVRPVMACLV